jgi:hypothetical protein
MSKSIFRAHGERGYTKLRNEFLQDKRISDETRGLVARLLSRPVDWHFTVREIIASGPSGRDKVYRILKEAEMYGYVRPENPRRDDGTYSAHIYLVTDDPALLIQRTASEILEIQNSTSCKTVSGPQTALPDLANPDTGNQEVDPLPEKPDLAKPLPAQPDLANPYAYKEKNRTKERVSSSSWTSEEFKNIEKSLKDALGVHSAQGGMLSIGEPAKWIDGGCDLELDILPTVRRMVANHRGGPIVGWWFFTRAVVEARDRRLTPLPILPPRPNGSWQPSTHRDWRDEQAETAAISKRVLDEL